MKVGAFLMGQQCLKFTEQLSVFLFGIDISLYDLILHVNYILVVN